MLGLPSIDRFLGLANLIRFCRGTIPLEVDPRISRPRHFENVMAANNSWFPKISRTESHKIIKMHIVGILKDRAINHIA